MPDIFQESQDKSEIIQHTAVVGLWVNIILTVLKGYAGVLSGSRALIADAVHSLSDLTTDIAIIVGARFWCKPPDDTHPLGHKGIETVVSLFIGLMLLLTGVGITIDSLKAIGSDSSSIRPSLFAIIAAVLSLVAKEVLFRWTLLKARETGSGALAANAWHHRSDGFSSIPVLVAVTASFFSSSFMFLDSIGGFIVSIFVIKAGWNVLQPVIGEVTNSAPPSEVVSKMKKAAEKETGVISIHKFRARMQGGGIYVDLHLQVDSDIQVIDGYAIGKSVEVCIMECDSSVRDVIARVEPFSPCGDADNCSRLSKGIYSREKNEYIALQRVKKE